MNVEHSVLVIDLDVMGFLGNNSMEKRACKLNFSQKSMTIDDQTFAYHVVRIYNTDCVIRTAYHVKSIVQVQMNLTMRGILRYCSRRIER